MTTPAAPRAPLLPIEAAREAIIAATTPVTGEESAPLGEARGRILARGMASPRALPVFDHSAMDGYALALRGGAARYALVGQIGRAHV